MGKVSKTFALVLTLTILISCLTLLTVKPSNAQTTSKPSTPTFTLILEDNGVGIYIQNQPVIPNGDDNPWIYYDIQTKWHESTNWFHNTVPDSLHGIRGYVAQLNSNSPAYPNSLHIFVSANSYYDILGMSSSHQIDYQIRAINGYLNHSSMYSSQFGGVDPNSQPVIIVDTSDWSPTQTITLPAYTAVPNQTASPTQTPSSSSTTTTLSPTQTSVNGTPSISFLLLTNAIALIVIAVLLVVIIALLFIVRHRKTAKL